MYIYWFNHFSVTGMLSGKMLRMIHNWSLFSGYLLQSNLGFLHIQRSGWFTHFCKRQQYSSVIVLKCRSLLCFKAWWWQRLFLCGALERPAGASMCLTYATTRNILTFGHRRDDLEKFMLCCLYPEKLNKQWGWALTNQQENNSVSAIDDCRRCIIRGVFFPQETSLSFSLILVWTTKQADLKS